MRAIPGATRVGFGRRVLTWALLCVLAIDAVGCVGRGPLQVQAGPDALRTLGSWSRVRQLQVPADVEVATDESVDFYTVIAVENDGVIALRLNPDLVPTRVVKELHAMVAENPARLGALDTTATVTRGKLEVGPRGLFWDGERVADVSAVITRIPREQVRYIRGTVNARGNGGAAFLGGWLGASLGLAASINLLAEGDGVDAWLSLAVTIGAGIAGARLLSQASTHPAEGFVYRRVPGDK